MTIEIGRVGTLVIDPDVAASESPRPYLHPLRDARGRPITEFRPADHDWHHGLSIAVAVVRRGSDPRPVSFWGGPTFVRDQGYTDLHNHGTQVVVAHEGADLDIEWRDDAGRTLLTERRSHRLIDLDDDTWALEISSTWLALDDLRFGSPTTEGRHNAGYGGLFLRADPRFVGGTVLPREDSMGAIGPWCALVRAGEGTLALTVAADSAVPDGPWFVREEPVAMLCAAPFFHEEWMLAAGATAHWRWWLVSSTRELDAASLDRLVADLP